MFTRSDLSTLMDAAPPLGVSIFLPTHVRGSEIRQDPIRLKNLVAEARDELLATGLSHREADGLLAPAAALIDDYSFWRHQDQGLALFLGDAEIHRFMVPLPLAEQVLVGPGFHITPLLPVLAADGAFHVLTITADRVRLFDASRFALTEVDAGDLPGSLDDVKGAPDYQNPVQAAPVARPHTGSVNISNAQVYGDSPEDWRKNRLVEYVRQIAGTLQDRLASDQRPVVLVANAEVGGHFQKLGTLGPLLAGVVETNPEAMDTRELHEAAYAVMLPRLDAGRKQAVERFAALLGSGDGRAATGIEEVVRAAYQGRVETFLLAEGKTVCGRFDKEAEKVIIGQALAETGQDLIEAAAVQTLCHGGSTFVLSEADMPQLTAAAIMRY
jgi:hypothetical protein